MKEKLQFNQITNLIRNVHVLLAVMWTHVLKKQLTLPLQNKNVNEKKKSMADHILDLTKASLTSWPVFAWGCWQSQRKTVSVAAPRYARHMVMVTKLTRTQFAKRTLSHLETLHNHSPSIKETFSKKKRPELNSADMMKWFWMPIHI